MSMLKEATLIQVVRHLGLVIILMEIRLILDIQSYIVKIKSQKTSKFYGYKKVTAV